MTQISSQIISWSTVAILKGERRVREVQVTDLENAAYLPNGRCIKGMLAGNDN